MPLFFICHKKNKLETKVLNKYVTELHQIAKDERKEPSDKIPSVKSVYVPKSSSARVVHIHARDKSESRKSVKLVQ
jgi:hypothetical protein